jgi:hypothetical protein
MAAGGRRVAGGAATVAGRRYEDDPQALPRGRPVGT